MNRKIPRSGEPGILEVAGFSKRSPGERSDTRDHGMMPPSRISLRSCGLPATVHLSKDIDAAAAEQISLALSRRYMSADAYFELKKFSYYPRDFKKLDFLKDARNSAPQSLPFRLDTETALRAN